MKNKEAKIIALGYMIGCVSERQAGEETDQDILELSDRDQAKVMKEVTELCSAFGDRIRRLTSSSPDRPGDQG